MPSDNFVPNSVWHSAPETGRVEHVTTPLGQTCVVRSIDIPDLIEIGVLNQADSLTAVAQNHLQKSGPGTGSKIDEAAIMRDPTAMRAIIGLADKILPVVVISPVVHLHYEDIVVGKTTVTKKLSEEQREAIREKTPGVVFTDQIAFEDKMWLFEYATGGLKAMQSFRDGPANAVGSVAGKPKRKNKAKRPSGTN